MNDQSIIKKLRKLYPRKKEDLEKCFDIEALEVILRDCIEMDFEEGRDLVIDRINTLSARPDLVQAQSKECDCLKNPIWEAYYLNLERMGCSAN